MIPRRALDFARENRERFVEELKEFLRFPTVSSHPSHSQDHKECADWLARHLRKIGLQEARVLPTAGNPIVYGQLRRSAVLPTVLIYGHYDVLPGEPLRDWRTRPFEPTIIGNRLHARGASDDKGQLFIHLKAIEAYLATGARLPVNVKCIFEGEEEIGSPHLSTFIARTRKALHADVAVISDTRMLGPGRPAISYAQRGGLRLELELRGPSRDLHSGNFGGAVANPLEALCEMIVGMHDDRGRVAIPGFYDDVRRWSDAEREFMERNGPSDEEILKDAHVEQGWGEQGYSAYEQTTIRPALTVNGIAGGHQGPGAKGIIPSRAVAKLSFRLVPDQQPGKVAQLFQNHVNRIAPHGVTVRVRYSAPISPALINRNHPAMRFAAEAYRQGFGVKPVFVRSGGSIPVVGTFKTQLGIPTVLMGFGLPGDSIHGPNESLHLENFIKGIETSIWFLALAQQLKSASAAGPEMNLRGRRLGSLFGSKCCSDETRDFAPKPP